MATTQFGETNFVIQAAETEMTWTVSWGLQRDEWFNFQIAPDFNDGPNDERLPTTIEVTRQVVTVSEVYPFEVKAVFTVKNLSPAGPRSCSGSAASRAPAERAGRNGDAMTLKVVIDAKNRIVAVAHVPEAHAGPGPALIARPVLGPGQREVDVVIPDAHVGRHPRSLMRGLHIDQTGGVVYRVTDGR
jgi:hypothetical protein